VKNLNRNDFTKEVNSNGYTISFKGVKLGGAGTMPSNYMKRCKSSKISIADSKMYNESAERDIQSLINGTGRKDMQETVNSIN